MYYPSQLITGSKDSVSIVDILKQVNVTERAKL